MRRVSRNAASVALETAVDIVAPRMRRVSRNLVNLSTNF